MEEALGSASRADVDRLSQSEHTTSGREDSQGPFRGSAGGPHGVYQGGKYLKLGGLADQYDLEQSHHTGRTERLSGR